jgi:hypothetical protein
MARGIVQGVEPTMILRLLKLSVRRSANVSGSPSAETSIASASSINRMRAVWRRKFRDSLPATTLSEPPSNKRWHSVLRLIRSLPASAWIGALAAPADIGDDEVPTVGFRQHEDKDRRRLFTT